MPWVCFTQNYDWKPTKRNWLTAYKAGRTYLVKQSVADQAIRDGKAKLVERPENARSRRSKI